MKAMVNTYCIKMKRGLVRKNHVEVMDYGDGCEWAGGLKQWVSVTEGVVMSNGQSTVLALLGIVAIILLSLAYSFSIVFPEFDENTLLKAAQLFAILEFTI